MKIEFCGKKEPKKVTIFDLKPGDVFRFKGVDGVYMAMILNGTKIYINLVTNHCNSMSSIRCDLHNCAEILEVELKIYE